MAIPCSVCLRWLCFHVYLIALNISGVWLIQTVVSILPRLLREPERSHWHRIWHYKIIDLEWGEIYRTPQKLTEIVTYGMCYV